MELSEAEVKKTISAAPKDMKGEWLSNFGVIKKDYSLADINEGFFCHMSTFDDTECVVQMIRLVDELIF